MGAYRSISTGVEKGAFGVSRTAAHALASPAG